jgi:glycosyltransferase involved in cell wall biosynthesis
LIAQSPFRVISVVIPARNETALIGNLVRTVMRQQLEGTRLEVIVVDDGSTDGTAGVAARAGARVIPSLRAGGGNPAAARNRGAAESQGDPIVFLDADCVPRDGWLAALLAEHEKGTLAVGGSLALPPGVPASARCDYYCGWYHVHPGRAGGSVAHHPPGNLSVRRAAFEGTGGFDERQPIAYAHEELAWQAELRAVGGDISFRPDAIVDHHNRPGFGNLLRRGYRWGYSAIQAKAESGNARLGVVYRFPRLLVAVSWALPVLTTPYILWCWLRAGVWEPLLMTPLVFAGQCARAMGMTVGGFRWLRQRRGQTAGSLRPRWE